MTPWRNLLYKEISKVSVSGKVLDLGGSKKSGYHDLIKGASSIDVANIDSEYGYDIYLDLEKKFNIGDSTYDGALAINVLEHVYDYRNFLGESHRILKQGGSLVIGVPFLIQVHPCPNDYWRFTADTLNNILTEAGFNKVEVKTIGIGPFTASAQLCYNIMHFSILRRILYAIAVLLDKLVTKSKNYPLGYLVIAQK